MAVIYAIGESVCGDRLQMNEDSFQLGRLIYPDTLDRSCRAARELDKYWQYYSLADGTGGPGRGDIAARYVQKAWADLCDELIETPPLQLDYLKLLKTFYRRAQGLIQQNVNRSETRLVGASVATALFQGEKVYLSSVGSCRIFMKRGDDFFRMSEAPLRPFPDRGPDRSGLSYPGLSLQSGVQDEESFTMTLEEGDEYYLVSDGVCRSLAPRVLENIMTEPQTIKVRIERLMRLLRHKGLRDSASILVLQVQSVGESDHLPEVYDPVLFDDSFDDLYPEEPDEPFERPSTLSMVFVAVLLIGFLFLAFIIGIVWYYFYLN